MTRDPIQRTSILHVVLQSERHGDCAIAALASYLGRTYEQVLVEAARVTRGDVLTRGLHTTELCRVARRLGVKVTLVPWDQVDVDEATGVLHVVARIHDETYSDHMVIFRHGDVLDCRDGTLWDSDVYFRHFCADPVSLMVEA